MVDLLRPGRASRRPRATTWGAWSRPSTRCSTGSRASGERAVVACSPRRRPSARDRSRPPRRGRPGADRRASPTRLDRRFCAGSPRRDRRGEGDRPARPRRGAADLERASARDARAARARERSDRADDGVRTDLGHSRRAPVRPSLPELEPETELAVYRVAQESLTNVARHAQASRVTITLARALDNVVLCVVDDGRGFDAPTTDEHGGLRAACVSARCSSVARSRSLQVGRRCRGTPGAPGDLRGADGGAALMSIPLVTRILIADDIPIVRSGLRSCSTPSPTSRSSRRPRTAPRRSRRRSRRTSTWRSSTSRCRA